MKPSTATPRVRPWHLANTTIRTPFRLKGGLEAIIAAGYEGNMGKSMEEQIAWSLHDAGIISLSKSTDDVTSITRKWRSVLVKLGFIWPDVNMRPKIHTVEQSEINPAFTLTPNGRRLLTTKSVQAEQEVLLRSIAALLLPSPLEPGYGFTQFSPLRHVIRILTELERRSHEVYITRLEMASIVLLTNGSDSINDIVERIVRLRMSRAEATSRRRFDADHIRDAAKRTGQKVHGTLYDYQDVTFRYLKATGLFQSRGHGITFSSEKRKTALLLADEPEETLSDLEYVLKLCNGAKLPTDTTEGGSAVFHDLLTVAEEWNISFDTSEYNLGSPEGISLARHDLEYEVWKAKELQYAADQPNQIGEILAYLQLIEENRKWIAYEDERLTIRKEERPAYFEWLLWRVLLALGELVIPPYEVRRFKVDQDFLPVGTAPGGGADVIGEYIDSALVVEVTLTESSRQEAAEGEPVRRHVATILEKLEPQNKDVYGLFVARRIDTNTAETFRIGVWYLKNDRRVSLDIVPLTIAQLRNVLSAGVKEKRLDPSLLLSVIKTLSEVRKNTNGAPEWKKKIEQVINA